MHSTCRLSVRVRVLGALHNRYSLVERKLFSLPKLVLLPALVPRHPALWLVFPVAITMDYARSYVSTQITDQVQTYDKKRALLVSKREQIEAFDQKHSHLVLRSGQGSAAFVQRQWHSITTDIQSLGVKSHQLSTLSSFIHWLYWSDMLIPTIEVALSTLVLSQEITISELMVYSRAIEDTIDTLLMRSRSEAAIARMVTESELADKLAVILSTTALDHNGRLIIEVGN